MPSFSSVKEKYYRTGAGALLKTLSPENGNRQLNVHLCGDKRAGKTTLRKSLCHCIRTLFGTISLPSTSVKEPHTLESTIGLEKESVSNFFGGKEFVLFDYGGQDEYHVNHSPHLASGPDSMYIVVVGLAEVDNDNKVRVRGQQDESECLRLVERYEYWLRFINSVASPGSLVVTVLNFKSVVSAAFCNAVQKKVLKLQKHVKGHHRLRNLNFWKDVIIGDLFKTTQVYASSFFKEMENAVTRCSSSVMTGGVAAVRRFKRGNSSWPRVVAVDEFKMEYVFEALQRVSEVYAAKRRLSTKDWNLLEPILLTETVKALRSNGDILEVNGFVVTDFNWFTSNVLGELFRGGWGKTSRNSLSSVFDFAKTSQDIEDVTKMRHNFGGDVDALPKLLNQLRICKRLHCPGKTEKYWFPAFQPVSKLPEMEFKMCDPVRVVKRRFYLNEDYIFPPGYFAELYMKVTDLDLQSHQFGYWEKCMKFESLFEEGGAQYRIGVYVTVDPSKYFDLVVCSTNHENRSVAGRSSHRVWNWLNKVRSFVYSYCGECTGLVKEYCLDPLNDYGGERTLQEVIAGKDEEGNAMLRRFYYGTCSGSTAVEVSTSEEMDVYRGISGARFD